MTFVCAYSLVAMYIFKPIIMSNNIDYPTIVNSVNNIFYNFGIAFVLKSEYYIRNFSFFREPGVYQTFIVLALVFLLFCKNLEENKIKKIGSSLLFIITIVSTFSTTGIVILTMILTMRISNNYLQKGLSNPLISGWRVHPIC